MYFRCTFSLICIIALITLSSAAKKKKNRGKNVASSSRFEDGSSSNMESSFGSSSELTESTSSYMERSFGSSSELTEGTSSYMESGYSSPSDLTEDIDRYMESGSGSSSGPSKEYLKKLSEIYNLFTSNGKNKISIETLGLICTTVKQEKDVGQLMLMMACLQDTSGGKTEEDNFLRLFSMTEEQQKLLVGTSGRQHESLISLTKDNKPYYTRENLKTILSSRSSTLNLKKLDKVLNRSKYIQDDKIFFPDFQRLIQVLTTRRRP